jgi:hypothetical protein
MDQASYDASSAQIWRHSPSPNAAEMKAQSDTTGEQPGHSGGVCYSQEPLFSFLPLAWASPDRACQRKGVSV